MIFKFNGKACKHNVIEWIFVPVIAFAQHALAVQYLLV